MSCIVIFFSVCTDNLLYLLMRFHMMRKSEKLAALLAIESLPYFIFYYCCVLVFHSEYNLALISYTRSKSASCQLFCEMRNFDRQKVERAHYEINSKNTLKL